MNRETILKKLETYKRVPGHGPDLKNMTDTQLEKYLAIMQSMFNDYFEDEE